MNPEEIIKEIKKRGYWDITIRPTVFNKTRIQNRQEALNIIRESAVELRGWYYPHIRTSGRDPHNIAEGIEQYVYWENHIEIWRLFLSGQFVHLLGLREDWLTPSQQPRIAFVQNQDVKNTLGVTGTLFTITEIFEFAKRLAVKGILGEEVAIYIVLNNTERRGLLVDSPGRLPFLSPKVCLDSKWEYSKVFGIPDLVQNYKDLAFAAAIDLFELFNWSNPPIQAMKEDQIKFLDGKY